MPLSVLLVEGNLDSEILSAVFEGAPAVKRGGSKNSLKPQARHEREHNHVAVGYLRDRDFDYEPPNALGEATVDSRYGSSILGWRWARHEIENYLIDPVVVARATGIPSGKWSDVLVATALRIRWYQIERWTIGQARRSIPPSYRLETRPPGLREFQLPENLAEKPILSWCTRSIREFANRVTDSMSEASIAASTTARGAQLSVDLLSQVENVLIWCSGKDLLAGLDLGVLSAVAAPNAGALRGHLRDWVRANADIMTRLFPEWNDLVVEVRRWHSRDGVRRELR